MSQSPQRPYVPHRTPTRGQPAIASSDFALTRPFVPDEEQIKSVLFEPAALTPAPVPVEVFNETLSEEPDELPPLEHFLDPLPPISDFSTEEPEVETDWEETDWQRYDWSSVAALGDTERAQAEASDDWASTDWEVPAPGRIDRSANPADAIATALDQIAERLRKGDLSLPGSGGVADPATIAATLAALLGVRR
ncbi:MAG TPA: hypothetical protein VJ852_00015 [Gemmatimonadaceae bacterium]|nr:hypothetical protein [Gemmatimonadaceae bacterium]